MNRAKNGFFCHTPGVEGGRNIPRKAVLEMLFTGEPISAERAYMLGFINRIVDKEGLKEEVSGVLSCRPFVM